MVKGPFLSRYNLSIVITTLGGMGEVMAEVKVTEGHKTIAEYEVPLTNFPGNTYQPTVVSRHEAELVFKKLTNNLEEWVKSHARL